MGRQVKRQVGGAANVREAGRAVVEAMEGRVLMSATPVADEFLVNTYTAGHQSINNGRSVAADANGNFVVVWHSQGQDGSGWGVYGQRFDATGAAAGAEFRVNTYTAGDQDNAQVAMDPAGNFVVTWESSGQDGSGFGVYGQRFDAAGMRQGAEFRVNSYTAGSQMTPSVAADDAGNFVIAWASEGQDPKSGKDAASFGVYAQRFSPAGARVGGEFRVNTFTADQQQSPAVGMDGAGNFVVAWKSYGQDGSGYGVYAQRFSAAAARLGGEFRANAYTAGDQRDPRIAMNGAGFTLAWTSQGQDGSSDGVYARRYDSAGATLGGEFRVNVTTADAQSSPSLDLDESGNLIVTWTSGPAGGTDKDVYGRQYDAAGNAAGGEFQVNTSVNAASSSVACQGGGAFVIAFTTPIPVGTTYQNDIHARRFLVDAPAAAPATFGTVPITSSTSTSQTDGTATIADLVLA